MSDSLIKEIDEEMKDELDTDTWAVWKRSKWVLWSMRRGLGMSQLTKLNTQKDEII